jgi:hypothetical protein
MRGGPAREAGFYIMPFCDPMCCRPAGPFITAAVALAWARQEVERYNPNAGRSPGAPSTPGRGSGFLSVATVEASGAVSCLGSKETRQTPKRLWWPRMPRRILSSPDDVDLKTIQALMGHADSSTTERCIVSSEARQRDALRRLCGQADRATVQSRDSDKSRLGNV